MHATVPAATETGEQSPIWERIDKPGANMRRNVPQPTGIVWDSPIKRKIRHGWLGKSATRVDG